MKFLSRVLLVVTSLFLFGCHSKDANTITVGTIAGPETQIMKIAANVAKKNYGLNVDIVTFTDYNTPNVALNDGDIDANMFQHIPYLTAQNKEHNYNIVSVGKVFIYPMGIYSQKIKKLSDLTDNAKVAIPNDPSNEARALLLLQNAGLITLKPNADVNATVDSIATNPKQLQISELDAAELPRALPDVDVALINTNYAIPAGIFPDQAIYLEPTNSPYANVVAVLAKNQNNTQVIELVKALHSPEVVAAAKQIFGDGAAIPAWDTSAK